MSVSCFSIASENDDGAGKIRDTDGGKIREDGSVEAEGMGFVTALRPTIHTLW
jgi:hypothetical protein